MIWSNWQGAIWRGAMLVLLFWTGLAWTQTPGPGPNPDPLDKIMVVTEGDGKKTRCRVMETWQLPDGRVAHLLQAIESGEMITIVDERGPGADPIQNPRAMAKRIFTWGQGRRLPPEGSPIPPHLRIDSGVIVKNEMPQPMDAIPEPGPVIVNRDQAPIKIVQESPALRSNPGLISRLFGRKEVAMKPADPQVVDFHNPPLVMNEAPVVQAPVVQAMPMIEVPAQPGVIQPIVSLPAPSTPIVNANFGPTTPQPIQAIITEPFPPRNNTPIPMASGPGSTGPVLGDSIRQDAVKPVESVKKGWYPGANISAWLHGRPTPPSAPKVEPAKIEITKVDDAKKQQRAEDFLNQQNKVADKQMANRIEGIYKTPFSTAMMTPLPNTAPPEAKKPEPTPLLIPNDKVEERPIVVPPPLGETVKPVSVPGAEKRDMWGNSLTQPILPPGKSLVDPPLKSRPNDPLLAPERLTAGDDRQKQKAGMLPPVARPEPWANPSNQYPAPREGQPVNWPPGTESVKAAHSGLSGQPMYIPVPIVTRPESQNPPMPTMPKGLDAPQLNQYVNAFTPRPEPKGAPQQVPMQGMMPPQAMANYGAPMMPQQQMMSQQQMMMQQQMMAQQQMLAQQQMMMQYGYRPSPAMMNPYMPQQQPMAQAMPSQGPTANFSRQYAGPQAPNPFGGNAAMQTGYAPMGYPPMQPMMPQPQPGMQPMSHQQPTMPTQQQAISQQVDQLIKVMRESPYPAQREWAAQSLTSFEWRVHPQVVPALIQSASQDPAASVRAGCVCCLGRMNAAVEPVFGTLHGMRNDIDPRVRAEVEQAFTRLGQAPMMPQN